MNDPKNYFHSLFERLANSLQSGEHLLCNFLGEHSDFVRLNHNRIRQASEVRQFELAINLISKQRSARAMVDVSGAVDDDTPNCLTIIDALREQTRSTPEDPYLLTHHEIEDTETLDEKRLKPAAHVVDQIITASQGLDLVGFYASGPVYRGFASSSGQRNWYQRSSFNFDWSCFIEGNRAVKSRYAGFAWDSEQFQRKTLQNQEALERLKQSEKSIAPGRYRVYLAPTAVQELLATVSWRGFSLKSQRTRQSALFRLAQGLEELHPAVDLMEHHKQGLAPDFTRTGFIRPAVVDLIKRGRQAGVLVSSRSAKEFDQPVNADTEMPDSLDMAPGDLVDADILSALHRGLYINNLWYTNYSDLSECRITGMSRYACFWVENGRLQAPISPMRFDESLYRMLGSQLLAITHEREWILSSDTYQRRSLSSMRLPGLLIEDFAFTL